MNIGEINNMSEYNDNNIHGELEEILDNAFNKYVREEYEYQELCVEFIDRTILEDPEANKLFETFKSLGVTDIKAKSKLIEYLLESM